MTVYIIRRLLICIPILFGVTLLTFLIVNARGNPVADLALNPRYRAEDIERIRSSMGLDEPVLVRYGIWVSAVLRGDLGLSLSNNTPVRDRIFDVLPNTIVLTGVAFLAALLISIPLGVISAVMRNTWFDHIVTVGTVAAFAVPAFWLGLMLILLFASQFREWGLPSLPVSGMVDRRGGGDLLDRLQHLILPALALALIQIGSWSAYIRSQMLETLRQDFVRTAHAKGLAEKGVLYGHAFRNAVLPLITLVGLSLPELFGGAVIIESIFAWNGIGRLTIEAVSSRDYTLIMGTTLMFAFLTMVSNLLADVAAGILDPRIRLG